MEEELVRTALLLGDNAISVLQKSRVAVFGIGGVGGYVCEALLRSGIGTIDIIDNDIVAPSNINRQIIATQSTIGMYKVDAMEARALDINPSVRIYKKRELFLPENASQYDFSLYDYVVDAVDMVSAKIEIIVQAKAASVPVISAMGAGNKLDSTRFVVEDIYRTSGCPLARVMRREMKKRNIDSLKVVYSQEPAMKPFQLEGNDNGKKTIGSIAFVPSVVGLIIAGEVIKDLSK